MLQMNRRRGYNTINHFGLRRTFSHNTYVTDDRRTQHCSIATVGTVS